LVDNSVINRPHHSEQLLHQINKKINVYLSEKNKNTQGSRSLCGPGSEGQAGAPQGGPAACCAPCLLARPGAAAGRPERGPGSRGAARGLPPQAAATHRDGPRRGEEAPVPVPRPALATWNSAKSSQLAALLGAAILERPRARRQPTGRRGRDEAGGAGAGAAPGGSTAAGTGTGSGGVTLRGPAPRAAGSAMWGRADRAVKLLERNIPSILRLTRGVDLKINRRLCSKPLKESPPQPRSRSALRVPGHKPTDWEKKCLLWAGHFKKPEDIPETVSIEAIRAAQTTLRVKVSYVMIALTILGCIAMVIRGKQAIKRHETLTSINLEKKAQWKEEATQSTSAKP
uniref:Family with sequence similarity 162 member A n=2 Tax=Anser TaxID=8842 RepID=A0A8B9BDP0_9AVES